jgi:tetratricopeptide (TPR) repeat protein
VTFNVLPPKRMEGFPAPVPCYELVEISGLTRWRARSSKGLSSFVGRAEEISLLERAAREIGSSGQIAALVGTAGIGKSRVAHEFVATLRQKDWQIVEAEANPLEHAVPYALLKKLLQSASQVADAKPAELLAPAEAGAPAHADLWPAALCSVLDQPIGNPRWHDLEPLLRRRVIIDAVQAAVGKVVTGRPTVLLLEDLHWIDGQSETVIEALMSLAASKPLLVLLTWRTEYTPGWLAKLDVRRIWLRSLDAASANVLLDSLLGTSSSLDALKVHIIRHTGQIPLFIEEVARQLISRGVLTTDAGRFAAKGPWDALEIPPTVQGVIASRIDRLPAEDKALLQLASVVGPRVSPHLLAAVTGMPAAELQSRLWSLEILDFLEESRWLASAEYVFAHDLIREVAYESILRSQREVLHRRILTAMEASADGHEEDVAEALCHHALAAQDWDKVGYYGQLAARKALARSAFRDATGYFQTAIDAVDKLPYSVEREQRAIDLRIEARLAFISLGSIEQWFGLGRDGELRAKKIGDESRRLASIAVRAAALNFYSTPYEAIEAGEEAVALAERLGAAAWMGYAEYGLGQAYFVGGRYREAKTFLDRASARLTTAPENVPPGTTGSSVLVLCHMMKTMVHAVMGEYDDSLQCSRLASALAEKNDLPYDLIAADYGRGFMQMSHGNLDEAETALDEALSRSRENEVHLFLPVVLSALGNVYLQRGQAAKARDILLEAREEADALGNSSSTLLASTYLASAHALLGDTSKGLEAARACQAGAKQKGYLGVEALAIFAEALILSLQGDAADAIARYERMIEIAEDLEAWPLQGLAKGALARLFAAAGRKSEAKDELEQAVELFARSKMTIQLERAKAVLSKFSDL